MTRGSQIGFDRRVKLPWLEYTARLMHCGASPSTVREYLSQHLQDQIAIGSESRANARTKTISILLCIWVSPPDSLAPLRDDGLYLLQKVAPSERLAVHWGMTMAVYPFFGLIADVAGRLLRLQGSVGAAQVQRRVKEQLGDRETMARCTRYVLRTFVDWGVLRDTADKGLYLAGPPHSLVDPALRAWLVEAALRSTGADMGPLRGLVDSPAFFPFSFAPTSVAEIDPHKRLEWFRQGISEDMVALVKAG